MEQSIDSKLRIDHKDFIGIYENAIDPRFCDFIVDYMDKAEFVDFKRNFSHVKDKQICLDGFSPSIIHFGDRYIQLKRKSIAEKVLKYLLMKLKNVDGPRNTVLQILVLL